MSKCRIYDSNVYIVMYLCNSIKKITLKSYRSAHTGLRSYHHNIDMNTKLKLNYSPIFAKFGAFLGSAWLMLGPLLRFVSKLGQYNFGSVLEL